MTKTTAIVHTLTLAAALTFGSAHAAVYQGRFDPVEYQGFATFEIPDGCKADTDFVTVGTVDCPQVDFLGATVTNHDAPPVTGTLTFGSQSDVATLLQWVGGVLVGLDTFEIGPTGPNGTFNNAPGYLLQFHVGEIFDVGDFAAFVSTFSVGYTPGSVDLLACNFGCDGSHLVGDTPATQEPFAVIPEPGVLALLATGLVAGWAARRRRS